MVRTFKCNGLFFFYITLILLILILIRNRILDQEKDKSAQVYEQPNGKIISEFGSQLRKNAQRNSNDKQPTKKNNDKSDERNSKPTNKSCHPLKSCCRKIFQNHQPSIDWAKNQQARVETDQEILDQLSDCSRFFDAQNFVWGPISTDKVESEVNYPIAYSILVHLDLVHLKKTLKSIYQPQNLYCIHVDRKSVNLKEKVQKLTRCFPNVFLSQNSNINFWGGFGILNSTIDCLTQLVRYANYSHNWDYFINLSGQDMPLKTNLEMVEILKTWNGASNVEILEETNTNRYEFQYRVKVNKFGNPDANERTNTLKEPPPLNLKVHKGNLAVILSRDLSNWLVHSENVRLFLHWLEDTDIPDEHFFSTILANSQKFERKEAVGAKFYDPRIFRLTKPYVARYVTWKAKKNDRKSHCGGKFVRDVCVFGVKDLHRLAKVDHFFANKFYANFEPMTYACLEEWLRSKRHKETLLIDRNE